MIIILSTESTVFFSQASYSIAEDIGEFLLPVKRTGDLSKELMVICYTEQGLFFDGMILIYIANIWLGKLYVQEADSTA